ncbi:Mitochondrial amidoxime-reducing component 1 [Frankliniella fusca]|uniref:Mitochondrial amidoxime-reducing component 1 n=1 Tax=Frankliniella fusca TaxID=407009 RepID=A0AAE1L9I1_9NEOP|nr:Mitochondrial amidoxime-reducing component 1 [Frankliniella fusca]
MPLLPESLSAAPGRALAVAAGAAVAVGLGVTAARRLVRDRPPPEDRWRRVGTLAELCVFPLKSGLPVSAESLFASQEGVCQGALRDRVFVAVNRNGRFVSGRSHPLLLQVAVKAVPKDGKSLDDVVFELSCSRVPTPLRVDPEDLANLRRRRITVQGTTVSAVDCGDAAAAWIRKAVVEVDKHGEATEEADLRLAFFPRTHTDRAPTKEAPKDTVGIYSDLTAYHLLTTSSLAALNAKLASPVTARHFRPNFVVDGPEAFDEDNWTWIRIGDKAMFRVIMPCGRCVFTTVDPETGVKAADCEPLRTLNTFRKPNEAQKKAMGGSSPMLGVRMGLYATGEVAVGDAVYVA